MGFFCASTIILQITEKQWVITKLFVCLPVKLGSLHDKTQVMKTLITLIFVLVIGAAAQAQNPITHVTVGTIATSTVIPATGQETMMKNENDVSVIYIFKNTKVRKALSFKTNNDKAKLA